MASDSQPGVLVKNYLVRRRSLLNFLRYKTETGLLDAASERASLLTTFNCHVIIARVIAISSLGRCHRGPGLGRATLSYPSPGPRVFFKADLDRIVS